MQTFSRCTIWKSNVFFFFRAWSPPNPGLAASSSEGAGGCLATLARAAAAASAPAEDRLMATSRTAEAAQPHDAARLSFVHNSRAGKTQHIRDGFNPATSRSVAPHPPPKEQQKPPPERRETRFKISLWTDQYAQKKKKTTQGGSDARVTE